MAQSQTRQRQTPVKVKSAKSGAGVQSFAREPRLLPLLMQHRLKHHLDQVSRASSSELHLGLHHSHNHHHRRPPLLHHQNQHLTSRISTTDVYSSTSNPVSVDPQAPSAVKVATTSLAVQLHHAGIAGRSLALPPLAPAATALGPCTLRRRDSNNIDETGSGDAPPRNGTATGLRVIACPDSDSSGPKSTTTTTISSTTGNKFFQSQLASLLLLAPNDDNSSSLALHGDFDTVDLDIDVSTLDLHQPQQLLLHLQHLQQRQLHLLAAAQDTGSRPATAEQNHQHHHHHQLQRITTTTTGHRSPTDGAMPPSALLDPTSGGTVASSSTTRLTAHSRFFVASADPDSQAPGAGRKPGQQSSLAKLVMNGKLNTPRSTPPTSSPALHASPTHSDSEHLSLLPPPARDGALLTPAMAAMALPSALKAMHDLTDTPQLPLSLNSTAPSSPRIPPLRQNSGTQTPRVRPHATTLNIPGMTRSKVSPDGRIPQRDVAAKLVIIMVGLPARGKSYITKKLQRYLSWQQHESQVFNVGNRRRKSAGRTVHAHPKLSPEPARLDPPVQAAATVLFNGIQQATGQSANQAATSYFEPTDLDLNTPKVETAKSPEEEEEEDQSAKFFNPRNEKAAKVREQVAMETLDELLDYLLVRGGSVGILDATNSTIERRQRLVERIRQREPKLGILFIESICRDKKLLEANMRLKLYGPDYRDKDPVQSLADFKERVAAYESAYVPLGEYEEENDLQYIQMIDVGRKLIQHRLRGFLSGGISTYLGSFNLSPRQIWITRHGQSMDNELGKLGGNSPLTERGHCYAQALHKFITHKRKEWLINEKSKEAQATFPPLPGDNTPPYPEKNRELEEKNFCVWTSMLQRSVETAEYFEVDDDYDVKNWEMLNELNAGQFEGMTYAEIAREHPGEFNKRARDKLNYIYPGVGGEGYLQVISRLRDMVREMERITDHVLIIGHRSVCRVLMAYFMDLTREDITDMDVPLGALYAIEPKPYGIAFHAYKYNEQNAWFDEVPNHTPTRAAQGSI